MKTTLFFFLVLGLTSTAFVAQRPSGTPLQFLANEELGGRAQITPPKKPSQILFDFRVNQTSNPSKIPLATQRHVLGRVFRKYLSDEKKCNPPLETGSDSDPLKAARNAGQIVPSILDVATGSFTATGRTETLYLISVGECNATHADNFGTKRAAIFAGEQLVANVDVDFKSSIVRKTDLNGDGVDELLMTAGDIHQGILTEVAALIEFRGARVHVIEDFGLVTEDSCASLMPGSSAKASVVSMSEAMPPTMPKLRIQNYEAGCRKTKRWRFISNGKMQ